MMLDILTTVAPVFDVLGSIPITTDHLHEAAEHVEHAAELVHTDEIHADEHSHAAGEGILSETWSLISDPAHAISEIAYNIAWDLIVIPVAILLYKKIREPKLRAAIHKEIDDEHGVTHEDCSGGSKEQSVKEGTSVSAR